MTLSGIALLAASILAFKAVREPLDLGETAPMSKYPMKDISGVNYTLNDLKKENGLLVIFSCNTCPFVIKWEDTYPELGEFARENNVGMVLVNSNEAKRKGDDSYPAMVEHAEEAGYNAPYVIDTQHQLADAFGAKTTPHVFLLDKDMKLVYRGAIDDRYEGRKSEPDNHYLKNAMKALVNGKPIEPAVTRQVGCSIKRVKV